MKKLYVIKIGGNVIDNPDMLKDFIEDFSKIEGSKLLIHGGGKLATELADNLGIKQTMIDGRRVTDAETLNVAVMVYAGLINKNIVAKLQAQQINAFGFCGADGNLVKSKKRVNTEIDFGYVGDIIDKGVNINQFENLIDSGIVPVISPITHDGLGNLLNTNADTLAAKIASALSGVFDVELIYCFEKNGVLLNLDNEDSFIRLCNKERYKELKSSGIISKGMLPKLDNAFEAMDNGVSSVTICHAKNISGISENIIGTQLVK